MKKTATKSTRNGDVRRFAARCALIRGAADKFVSSHCNRTGDARKAFKSKLFNLMAEHAALSCEIILWCCENNVDLHKFATDISIAEVKMRGKRSKND